MFIFVVPCLHKHLCAGERMYRRWMDVLITWLALKLILKYLFGFQYHRSVRARTTVTVCIRRIKHALGVLGPSKGHRVHQQFVTSTLFLILNAS